ncbi:MAG: tetratricopeptide repeat protein [Pirellulaceae bacterium]
MAKLLRFFASLFGFEGRSSARLPDASPRSYSAADHPRIYRQGCDLISPYMQLHAVKAKAGHTERARQDLHRGIELLEHAIAIHADNWSAYWMIGKAYQALGDPVNACDAFGKSFSIQAENPDVVREYMVECLKLGRAGDGMDAAEHAVQLDSQDAGLVANLALAYLIGGRIDAALETVEQSLALDGDDEITQDLRSLIREVRDGKCAPPKSMADLVDR